MTRRRLLVRWPVAAFSAAVLVMLAPTTFGQSVLCTFDGDANGDQFGRAVSGAGDVTVGAVPVSEALQDPEEPTLAAPDEVFWKGALHTLSEAAAGQPERHRATLESWGSWVAKRDYRLALDSERRVLLIYPTTFSLDPPPDPDDKKRKRKKKSRKKRGEAERPEPIAHLVVELEVIERVFAHTDAFMPPPAAPKTRRGSSTSWTSGAVPSAQPDELPVLVWLTGAPDQRELLDTLTEQHDYLSSWFAGAGRAGFHLSRPLIGAWPHQGHDLEEWSPRHEMVNRLTRLLILQRYGRLPEWLSQGLAWQTELTLLESVYCFPRREEFVFATEHTGWSETLHARYRHRTKEPLDLDEVSAVGHGEFNLAFARRAWGSAEFLVRKHPEAVAKILADLAADREANNRKDLGGGRWSLIADYETPLDGQRAIIERHLGEDVFEEMTAFFRTGQ